MTRGPGANRRFNKRDFVLAEVFQAGKSGNLTQKQYRDAQYKARLLRNGGNYARIVNGSGWTAIYIGVQTAGMPVIQAPPAKMPQSKKFEPTRKNLDPKKRFDALELQNKGRNIPLELGIQDKIKKAPDIITTSTPKIKRSVNVKKVFLNNADKDLLPLTGLGYFGDKPTNKTIQEIDDSKIVKGDELVELLESVSVQRSKKAFESWLTSNPQLNSKYQNTPRLKKLFLVMLGRKEVNKENLEGVELFVIYSDNRPVMFQYADGEFSKSIQRVEQKIAEEDANFKGWDKFQIRNQ